MLATQRTEAPPTSTRLTLVDKENYKVDLEYNKDFAILHLPYVNKMTKEMYLDMKSSLTKFYEFIRVTGYDALWAAISPEDKMTAKLITKLGFEYTGEAESLHVYRRSE